MEKQNTMPYSLHDALMDISAARITLEMMTLDGGIFSYSRESAEKELGTAYIMSRYESIGNLLAILACHLGRAENELERVV